MKLRHLLAILLLLSGISNPYAQCTADAGPDTSVCIGASIQLGATVSGTGPDTLSYNWSPATGLSCTDCANPLLTVSSSISYTLTVTSTSGCSATSSINITALPLPIAGFTVSGNNNCSNIPLTFTNTSSGTGLSYSWNFGDPGSGANSSTATNPSHQFDLTGSTSQNYTVVLIVTDAFGCNASYSENVTVLASPGPSLIDPIADMRNCDGSNFDLTVYDASATNQMSDYTIQWGDGSPDFNATSFPGSGASHTYSTAEIFTLNYIVTGNNGCIDTATYNIANITNPAIGAANPGATTGCGPLTLCFPLNNYASNHATTYYVVDYGDGSPLDTLSHPPPATICHVYSGSSCGQSGNQYVFSIKAVNLCDSSAASISPIRVYTGPQSGFTPSANTICAGSSVTLVNTTQAGFNSSCSSSTLFQWDFGDGQTLTTPTLTNPVHTYATPGTYTVTLSTSNSCGSTIETHDICVEAPPVPDFTLTPDSACIPFIVQLTDASITNNTCNVNRNWTVLFNGSPCLPSSGTFSFVGGTNASSLNPQIQFSQPGNYSIRLTLSNTCGSFTVSKNIVAQTTPQINLAAVGPVCANSSISPSANVNDCLEPSDGYSWSFSGGTPPNSTQLIPGSITYTSAGTYPITFSATNACGTTSTSTNITVTPIPPALNPQVNTPLCEGDTAWFTADTISGVNYSWNGPGGFSGTQQSFTLNSVVVAQSGTYTLTGSINGCSGPPATVDLTVNPNPVISITPITPAICFGNSIPLTATGATTYSWTPLTGLSSGTGTTVSATPDSTQTYVVTGNDGNCNSSAPVTVVVNPLPIVNAGPDTTVCDQPIPFQLIGTPAGGSWIGPNATATGIFTPNGIGSFTLTYSYTDANGCSNTDQRVMDVIAPTQPDAGSDMNFCLNSALQNLTATPSGGTWSGPHVTPAGEYDPATVGTDTLIYTFGSGTCLLTDTVIITVFPLPVIDPGTDQAICPDAATLTLNGIPAGGTWSGTGITNTIGEFTAAAAGVGPHILHYDYTDVNGCMNEDSLTITVNPFPVVNAGPDSSACNQPVPFQLSGAPAGGTWSGPNIDPGGVFTPNGTGVFTLTYTFTDSNGCTATDSRDLTIADPTIADAGTDTSSCINGPDINLNASPPGGTWIGTNVTAGGVFSPVSNGTFEVVYVLGNGSCQTSDTIQIVVFDLPVANAGADLTLCSDAGPQTLNGIPTGGTWSGNGITDPNGIFTPTVSGTGTHTLNYVFTDVNGCSDSDDLFITVNPLPVVNAGNDTTLCNQPFPVQFNGIPTGGTWNGAGITPGGSFTPSATGSFTVMYSYSDVNGCSDSDTRLITVNNPVQPDAGNDFSICIDAPDIILSPTPTGGTWSGTNITNSGAFSPTTAGTFALIYTYGLGNCQIQDTILATVNPLPLVDAGADFTSCADAPDVVLNGSPTGGTWSGTGIIVSSGDFSPSNASNGVHTLLYSYTDPNGCSSADSLLATINPLPLIDAGIDTTLCNQPFPVQFTGNPTGGTWTGGGITAGGQFTPTVTGTFTINYSFTDSNGCINSDDRTLTIVDPVQTNAGPDMQTCIDAPDTQLNGIPTSGTWSGMDVSSSGLFNPTTIGTFELVLSNGTGNCLTRDTMLFTVNPLPIVDAGNDQAFCPDDPSVNLQASPSGGTWSGNGVTDSQNGTFDPSVAGVGLHTLVYHYTDPATGCLNSDTLIAEVHPFPDAQFAYNPVTCVGTSETFTNNSTSGTGYNWDFGDGFTSVIFSPDHLYVSPGFYDVRLEVVSVFGCIDSILQTIEVRVPPIADFTLAPDSACGPLTVQFSDLSTGTSLTYDWNYGNGQTSSAPAPVSQVYSAGILADTNYQIILTVSNLCGSDSHTENVQVMPSPTAIFGTNTDIGCSPLTLDFVNNSLGLPDTYEWDFGDGTSGNTAASTFQHSYSTGVNDTTYTIQLIVSNECGSDTITHQITVVPNQVNAFFNVDAPSGCAPHTVNFTQYSQGSNFSEWDFGDGNGATSYNATHTFMQPGTYIVSLFANDGCSYDTTSVTIQVFANPVVDFSSTPDSVCIHELFTFTNLSNGVASVNWDFGDGDSSIIFNPQHAYTNSGTYQVTLSGTSQTNGCTSTVTKPIIVSTNPTAQFTATPNAGCVALTSQFQNQSQNASVQAWDFGDGNVSTAVSPSHTYSIAGNYTVKLYVENANGCADSVEQIITVYPNPIASFTPVINDPCIQPATVSFTNTSTGAMNYEWNLGNGQQSNSTNPVTSYATAGIYSISLIATSIQGCKDTVIGQVSIYQPASVNFNIQVDSICAGSPVLFQSSTQFADSVHWIFGDGTILSGSQVNYTYTTGGNYHVTVIAYGEGGCNDTLTSSAPLVIFPAPTANFTYTNVQDPDPLSGIIEFTNLSTNGDWYFWDFGNGDTSTLQNPTEQYSSYGEYIATLIVGTDNGCIDTIQELISVDFFFGLYIPNAVYPGHSDFEVSHFIPKGVGLKTFELLIYDDWGNLIWSTTALDADGRPTESWDATFNGVPVQQDAYVWKATATFINEQVWEGKEYPKGKIKRSGTVTVIR